MRVAQNRQGRRNTPFLPGQEERKRLPRINVGKGGDGGGLGYFVIRDGFSGVWRRLSDDQLSSRPDTRRVMVATQHKLLHFAGRTGRQGQDSSGHIYQKLFEGETPTIHEIERTGAQVPAGLVISPDSPDAPPSNVNAQVDDKVYAWLNAQGVFNGKLLTSSSDLITLGRHVFRDREQAGANFEHDDVEEQRQGTRHVTVAKNSLTTYKHDGRPQLAVERRTRSRGPCRQLMVDRRVRSHGGRRD